MTKVSVIEFFPLNDLEEFARLALEQARALYAGTDINLTPDEALSELAAYSGWRTKNLRTEVTAPARRSYAIKVAQRHLRKVVLGTVGNLPGGSGGGKPHAKNRAGRRVDKMRRQNLDRPDILEQAYLMREPPAEPDVWFARGEVDQAVDKYCPLLAALAKGVPLGDLRKRVARLPGSKGTPRGVLEMALREEVALFAHITGESPRDVLARMDAVIKTVNGTRGKYKTRCKLNVRRKPAGGVQPTVTH